MSDFSKLEIIRIERHERSWIKSPDAHASSQDTLCRRCAILDFEVLFARPFTQYRYPGTDGVRYPRHHRLGTVRYIRETQTCSFCRLVWHAMHVNSNGQMPPEVCIDGEEVDVELFSSAYGTFGLLDIYSRPPESYTVRLELSLNPRGRLQQNTLSDLEPFRSVIHRLEGKHSSHCLQGLPIRMDRVQLAEITGWLQHCASYHQETCGANFPDPIERDPPDSVQSNARRLVDTARECVVDVKADDALVQYATLSYVWGTEPFLSLNEDTAKDLHRPGYLSSKNKLIPQSIRDAITFCQQLATSYLWIDALCIEQDNHDQKRQDIAMMDKIYAVSQYNIVAATGDSAHAGLPGISRPRQAVQEVISVQGIELANVLPIQQRLIDPSV